jgi:hypothetical protein
MEPSQATGRSNASGLASFGRTVPLRPGRHGRSRIGRILLLRSNREGRIVTMGLDIPNDCLLAAPRMRIREGRGAAVFIGRPELVGPRLASRRCRARKCPSVTTTRIEGRRGIATPLPSWRRALCCAAVPPEKQA